MNLRSLALTTAALLTLCSVQPSAANELGFYIGANIGQASKSTPRPFFDDFGRAVYDFYSFTPAEVAASFDDADSTYSVIVGYRISRYFAVEGAYRNLGSVSYRSDSRGAFLNDNGTLDFNLDAETTGFQASVLGILPLNRNWELYGRAGVLFATNALLATIAVRGEVFVPPTGENVRSDFSLSSTEWVVGVGGSMRFFEMYDLRLEFQRLPNAGREDTGGVADIDVILLGVTATF